MRSFLILTATRFPVNKNAAIKHWGWICDLSGISIEKIIVTTPDVSFIFELEKFECLSLKELDLSACGDNIEISTTFTEKYADVKIYVSPTVKAKYPSNDNIIAK